MTSVTLKLGDCVEVLRGMQENSIDACVCDPPYGLEFMGMAWDKPSMMTKHARPSENNAGFFNHPGTARSGMRWANKDMAAFQEWCMSWAIEVLRVLKPGGHLLAMGGTRTYHRLVCAVEDAGFEIRDSVAWLYGQGFPKSLDVSKAIDKKGGRIGYSVQVLKREIRSRYKSTGLSLKQFNEACGFEASGYLRESSTWTEVLPSHDKWMTIKKVLNCDDDLDALFEEAEREIIGQAQWTNSVRHFVPRKDHAERVRLDITIPATPDAIRWQGWGTALKPAMELVCVARKPLSKDTVVENVLEWGTGAINVDGCRIPVDPTVDDPRLGGNGTWSTANAAKNVYEGGYAGIRVGSSTLGRWPANVTLGCSCEGDIHEDDCAVAMLDKQSGVLTNGKVNGAKRHASASFLAHANEFDLTGYGDTGFASRFFYTSKANNNERWFYCKDCHGPYPNAYREQHTHGHLDGNGKQSWDHITMHPTQKPVKLMEWLVRLVTPSGGTVLDPFMGSGTTGIACLHERFDFIGIEMNQEYLDIARARITDTQEQDINPLFETDDDEGIMVETEPLTQKQQAEYAEQSLFTL